MRLDAHPFIRSKLQDASVPLWITEGPRKADAAIGIGLTCIAIAGVWNWRRLRSDGIRGPLEDWDAIEARDRDVYLAFDSDVTRNENVYAARDALAVFLKGRGAHVHAVELPEGEVSFPSGIPAKVGLDDYIAVGHDADDLLSLTRVIDPEAEAVEYEYRKQRIRTLARDKLERERDSALSDPLPRSGSLALQLAEPREITTFTIAELHPTGGNVLLAAEYKIGKTTLVFNAAASLADEEPFLASFAVDPIFGNIGILNEELTRNQCLDWLGSMEIKNPERIYVEHLRGLRISLTSERGQDEVVKWLEDNEISYLIIDPFQRAYTGISSNDNDEVGRWLQALDVIKHRAVVTDLLLVHHFGREEHKEGREHGRGATVLDDWADARWLYVKEREDRFFSADGRDVHVPEQRVLYAPETRRLTLTMGTSRREARDDHHIREVVAVVKRSTGITVNDLKRQIGGHGADRPRYIRAAEEQGLIRVELGPRNAKHHFITPEGEMWLADPEPDP